MLALCAGVCTAPLLMNFSDDEEHVIYVDRDDTVDSIYQKLGTEAHGFSLTLFRVLAKTTCYSTVRLGRYDIGSGRSTLRVFRDLRRGFQTPLSLTIPIVRTTEDLAQFLGEHLEASVEDFRAALTDRKTLSTFGKTPETAICLFIPNTYEVYWTVSPQQLLERMQKESKLFWSSERKAAAQEQGLTPDEVITLASIVENETAYNPEKPQVAGMYLNRLRKSMPLQADPTVKFALGDFSIRRVLHKHLTVDSPYNTYRNLGLPPGPIGIPSLSSIEGVLHAAKHSYLYMCAKEDFSGSHNFAATYEEHLQNAEKYSAALNARNIH